MPASPTAPASSAWSRYHDALFGYSIEYPAGWMDVSAAVGAAPGSRYFSDEAVTDRNLGGLDENRTLFRVGVAPLDGRCLPGSYENTAFAPFRTMVDGASGTVAGYDSTPFADPESNVFVDVAHGSNCFMFMGVTRSPDTRDAFIPMFLQILSTFRF